MRRVLAVILAVTAVSAVGGASAAAPVGVVTFDASRAHVYSTSGATPLLTIRGATATSLARAFLRQHGVSTATVDSLRVVSARSSLGVRHVLMEQRVGGLRVAGAYVKAAVNGHGALVHLIENVVGLHGPSVSAGTRSEDALAAVLAELRSGPSTRPAVVERGARITRFAKTPFFHVAPTAERALLAGTDGRLHEGFVVQTWSEAGNALRETQVLGDGHVAASTLRTANDSYNVYPEDPLKGAQTVVAGPGAGNDESPVGWLSPVAQLTTNIVGNNVNAYLDSDLNNRPDKGGVKVTDGNFLAAANLALSPATTANRAVATQNLFYLNNVVHDILYSHGFDEAAGNFQEDNFSNGGLGGDSVNAEAQDGSGTDNANFATPADGSNPRMQMYLWTAAGPTHEVVVGATSYSARGAEFGKQLTKTGVTGALTLVDDGVDTGTDACEPLPSRSLRNLVALVDRGTCTFIVKVKNAQNAGAAGVIVGNNVAGDPFTMGGTDATIRIPAVMVSQGDRNLLAAQLASNATMRLLAQPAPQIDGDLDSDIVFHEYGHGLTWRMIGGMSGSMSGSIGEGAGDGLAMLINGDDRIGEYAGSNPAGIRRAPYAGYQLWTYGNVSGAEVHDGGEVYAAIVWRLLERFTAAGLSSSDLLTTYVDGMNYTPSGPAFEDMRDGMLQSAATRAPAQTCEIWHAFAQFGVGLGADGTSTTITESYAVPPSC